MKKSIIKEIETRTVRTILIEEVEQALCDQFDLGIPHQDDLIFEWNVTHPGSSRHAVVRGVRVTTVERSTETI